MEQREYLKEDGCEFHELMKDMNPHFQETQ